MKICSVCVCVRVRSEQHKNRPILDVEATQSGDGEECTAGKPKNGSQKPKIISLVDI